MCRSNNAEVIALNHLQWRDDHLLVYFRKQKNDQDGQRSKDPRCVYANPVKPEVCSILALGMYFLLYPPVEGQMALFPGKDQSQRFGKSLKRILKSEGLIDEITALGYDPKNFGTQSLRKGSATYAASGTTDAPSQMSINLRAGWSMTRIEKTYFRYERAGDQYVGRTVAGLPIQAAEFSILPPQWSASAAAQLEDVMACCFPRLPSQFSALFQNTLASVVHHVDWLRDNLPAKHPLFATRLFSSFDVSALKKHVACALPVADGDLQATGVPSHVALKVDLAVLKEQQKGILSAVTDFRKEFADTLRGGLNDFALSQGHMTFDKFKELLDGHLGAFDERLRVQLQQRDVEAPSSASSQPSDNAPSNKTYMWGGMLHLVPEDFELPSVTVQQAFTLWAAGSVEKGLPPFRMLTLHDMPSKNAKKRLSDFRALMNILEQGAKCKDSAAAWPRDGQGKWKSFLTPTEAQNVFMAVEEVIELPAATLKGRSRRVSQVLWSSHLKLFSAHQKDANFEARRQQKRVLVIEEDESDESDGASSASVEIHAAPSASNSSSGSQSYQLGAIDFDIGGAYARMIHYASAVLQLVEKQRVIGDGACLFRAACMQLQAVRPEIRDLTHAVVRRACVDWVVRTYGKNLVAEEVLVVIGYENWEDWRERMSGPFYYGDELCVEAIAAVYNVRILLVFCAEGDPSHRFIGNANSAQIQLGNVGDYHFYSLAPRDGRPVRKRLARVK